MTQGEKDRIDRLVEHLERLSAEQEKLAVQVKTITDALLTPPAGGDTSFMEEARRLLVDVAHGSWALRMVVRMVIGAGALAVAWQAIRAFENPFK